MRWEPRPVGVARPEALLKRFSANIQQLTERARAAVWAAVPEAVEQVRPSRGFFGYRLKHHFAFIEPLQASVRVGFVHGTTLLDPTGLLERQPSRAVCYVQLSRPADARSPALLALLQQAALLVPAKRPPRGRVQLQRPKARPRRLR